MIEMPIAWNLYLINATSCFAMDPQQLQTGSWKPSFKKDHRRFS